MPHTVTYGCEKGKKKRTREKKARNRIEISTLWDGSYWTCIYIMNHFLWGLCIDFLFPFFVSFLFCWTRYTLYYKKEQTISATKRKKEKEKEKESKHSSRRVTIEKYLFYIYFKEKRNNFLLQSFFLCVNKKRHTKYYPKKTRQNCWSISTLFFTCFHCNCYFFSFVWFFCVKTVSSEKLLFIKGFSNPLWRRVVNFFFFFVRYKIL